ncbi:hypothetical protein WP8S17C03_17610 [Metapseudomonas otitidis]|uniref:Uncharacterized protein n=1 Tax=Metapseudomonas otitidis TaxID=319939 RepID=A0A6S5RLF8_9GAMM|nr:hypothetical protein WP8S17C03_17610 [Pseudomonas otitidis]
MTPTNVRYAQRLGTIPTEPRNSLHSPRQYTKTKVFAELLTYVKEHLHSNTDSKKWPASFYKTLNSLIIATPYNLSHAITKCTYTGHYESLSKGYLCGILNNFNIRTAVLKSANDAE